MTPPKKRTPTKKATALKAAPPVPFNPDYGAPIYTALGEGMDPAKRPTFERWETHDEFLERHQFNHWLTVTLRKLIR